MSLYQKKAYVAALHIEQQTPSTHIVTNVNHYNVPLGTAPGAITFSGTTSRLVAKYDTAGIGLGSSPIKIAINYRIIGRPILTELWIGLRKAASDGTFTLVAGYPIETPAIPMQSDGTLNLNTMPSPIKTAEIQGFNDYQMLANDKLSIEFSPAIPTTAENTVQIMTSTTQSNPTGFTCQQYTAGSYANTPGNNPLAISISSKILTPI